MQIGFVTSLLWDRYGPFWSRLLRAAGAEVTAIDPDRWERAVTDARLTAVPGDRFRRAAAEAIALAASADRIVVPDLNPGYDGARGSTQDPFVADFPGALAQAVPGLPPLLSVPADLRDTQLESVATRVLATVVPPAEMRRTWQTHRAYARPPKRAPARFEVRPGDRVTVGLAGQPWNLRDEVVTALTGASEQLVSAHRLDPADLREEGWRIDPGLAPTDAEALGAVRLFVRRAGVKRVRLVVDDTVGTDAWLKRRAKKLARGALEVVTLPQAAAPEAVPAAP